MALPMQPAAQVIRRFNESIEYAQAPLAALSAERSRISDTGHPGHGGVMSSALVSLRQIFYGVIAALPIGFVSVSDAAIYKCEKEGKTSYSESPCPDESTGQVMDVEKNIDYNETGNASGWVDVDAKRLPIKGSVAVWYEDEQELWVYLFPFPLDETIREPMRETRGNGHQFRAVDSLNPDPAVWEQTPFVVFQFLFDENRRVRETVRHSRFVSWQLKIPTTINIGAEESKRKQHYQELYVTPRTWPFYRLVAARPSANGIMGGTCKSRRR
jgi:hypothetical protein